MNSTSKNTVVVVGNFEAGSIRAHAINTVKMAQGFAQNGYSVFLITKRGKRPAADQVLRELYGLADNIIFIQIPRRNWLGKKIKSELGYAKKVISQIKKIKPIFVYARDYLVPGLVANLGIPSCMESHVAPGDLPDSLVRAIEDSKADDFKTISTISPILRDNFINLGVPKEKVLVLPDAVDLDQFIPPRILSDSPYEEQVLNITYTGHLYDYKGIPTILETAKIHPQFNFHLVGGLDEDIIRHKKIAEKNELNNVFFHGFVIQKNLPPYLWHADVLLLPPSANHPSAAWTSPVKLGEYMASGTPIVATDIPALRYWLDDSLVEFASADSAKALATAITAVLKHIPEVHIKERIQRCRDQAVIWSYKNRTLRILKHAQIVN